MQRQHWARRLRLGVVIGLALACLVAIALLAHEVRAKLAALQRATSDNTQWSMMQTEVEVLRLQGAVLAAQANPSSAQLDEVRRWFNVFYSRVSMLERSALYAPLLVQPDYIADHARLRAYLDGFVGLIDGPDTELAAALDQIAAPLPDLRIAARDMTLNALTDFAAQSDLNRDSISVTLLRLALVAGALLLIVAGVAAMLALQFRRSESQKRALLETGARLSTIVATSADGIVVTDPNGTILEFNPAAEAIFGLTAAQLRGQNALSILFAEGAEGPQHRALIAALRDPSSAFDPAQGPTLDPAHGPVRIEVDARRADGRSFPAEVSLSRAQIAEAGLVVAFVRDISARRAAEAALTAARDSAQAGEKAKAEFLAVMSHEMRTPLNGLMGSMELLRRTTRDEDQRELLSVMEASGEILLGHVNSVLDVSRAEAGVIHFEQTVFDLDRLLEETVANQASLATAGGNHITLSRLTGPMGPVLGDQGRLRQVLLNLIGNAVKFTKGGEIGVEVERLATPEAFVEFRVTDTGIGIPEVDQARIFDDFVTLDASYGRSAGGTGLGLGIARRLARAMGGQIGVESVEGEGSLFWLRLPLPRATQAAPANPALSNAAPYAAPPLSADMPFASATDPNPTATAPAEDGAIGPALSVLLVEDNAINRFLLRRFLESGGHRVTEAADGVEGVAHAQETTFDVILMDISMPRMDGVAATQAIRAGHGPSAQARILALTAHALPQELARFRAAGMEATLTKPIARLTLLQALAGQPIPDAASGAAPTEAPPPDGPVIDSTALQDLIRQVGPATARRLILRLIAEADQITQDLSSLNPQTEAARMSNLCHHLMGSSGTFGTRGLRRALRRVETALKLHLAEAGTAPAQDLSAALHSLPALWAATRADLLDALTNLPASGPPKDQPDTRQITAP